MSHNNKGTTRCPDCDCPQGCLAYDSDWMTRERLAREGTHWDVLREDPAPYVLEVIARTGS